MVAISLLLKSIVVRGSDPRSCTWVILLLDMYNSSRLVILSRRSLGNVGMSLFDKNLCREKNNTKTGKSFALSQCINLTEVPKLN